LPAVHIHHKFIIDADTDQPTIYRIGQSQRELDQPNDENLLEITGSPALAQTYSPNSCASTSTTAHVRSGTSHPAAEKPSKSRAKPKCRRQRPKRQGHIHSRPSGDEWVRGAYKRGTPAFLERQTLAK
jgi:hypothetical protein